MHSFMLVAKHSKCDIQKCQVDVTMLHVSGCRSLWYDQFCKWCTTCQDTVVFSKCFYGYQEIKWQMGVEAWWHELHVRKGGQRDERARWGCMQSPPPHLSLHTAVYPRSEHVANAAHGYKGRGYVGKRGGGGGMQVRAAQDRRKGGAHANTICGAPPSSGARGKGSSPLCMWQTEGGNGRWHVQRGGGMATGEG